MGIHILQESLVANLPEKDYTPGPQEGCTPQEGHGCQQGYKSDIISYY